MSHDHGQDDEPMSEPAHGDTVADATAQLDLPADPSSARGRLATLWSGITAAVGAVMGLLPHLRHHVSFVAGAALMFSLSAFVIGPAISDTDPEPTPEQIDPEHSEHHG